MRNLHLRPMPLGGVALVLWSGFLAGCGSAEEPLSASETERPLSGEVPATRRLTPTAPFSLSQGLMRAFRRDRQRLAGPGYDVLQADNGWGLSYPRRGFSVAMSRGGQLDLTRHGAVSGVENFREDKLGGLRFSGLGRGGVWASPAIERAFAERNRVVFARTSGVTEWYLHGPLGVEQGFALEQRPGGSGPLEVRIAVVGSLQPRASNGAIQLLHRGQPAFRYHGLEVTDSRGAPVPATLLTKGQAIVLRVDDASATYPLDIDPWLIEDRLIAQLLGGLPDREPSDAFSFDVALDGDTAVVGAYQDDDAGADSGSAYVYARTGAGWGIQAKLTARLPDGTDDAGAGDQFGFRVGLSGDLAVVGARWAKPSLSGAAYVFRRAGGVWTPEAKFAGAVQHQLGTSVAVDGDTVLAGTTTIANGTGHVNVYRRNTSAWNFEAELLAPNPGGGFVGDAFGRAVALDGNTALVSAHGDDAEGVEAGAAYVFTRSGTIWNQPTKLIARLPDGTLDAAPQDYFGQTVDISGDTALIGAHLNDDGGVDTGSAYVFKRAAGSWSVEAKLGAQTPQGTNDAADHDWFGFDVAVEGDTAVIGARSDDPGGSAYVFQRSGTTWSVDSQLMAQLDTGVSDVQVGALFGSSVALSGATLLVGAPGTDGSGAAYLYVLCTPQGSNDATCDGIDDDCDGVMDEDYVSVPTTCGTGVCAAMGSSSCVAGAAVPNCTPGVPLATDDTTCDGVNDDCDGTTDEDCAPGSGGASGSGGSSGAAGSGGTAGTGGMSGASGVSGGAGAGGTAAGAGGTTGAGGTAMGAGGTAGVGGIATGVGGTAGGGATSNAGRSGAGSNATGGATQGAGPSSDPGGCGCRVVKRPARDVVPLAWLLAGLLVGRRIRRRRVQW